MIFLIWHLSRKKFMINLCNLRDKQKWILKLREPISWIFWKKISWDTCDLNADQKRQLEEFLVEYHVVFAKRRSEVCYIAELKIKLTPEHPLPVYVQGPPAPIHLRDEILIELALVQNLNFITTLSHSQYSSPIFVHRESSGKLRFFFWPTMREPSPTPWQFK